MGKPVSKEFLRIGKLYRLLGRVINAIGATNDLQRAYELSGELQNTAYRANSELQKLRELLVKELPRSERNKHKQEE